MSECLWKTDDISDKRAQTREQKQCLADWHTFLNISIKTCFLVLLSRFCWAESYVVYLLRCRSSIRTTEAASETNGRERERERAMTKSRTPPFWMYENFGTERICTSLVYPRTFFVCTHIHTSLPFKILLEWHLPFMDHRKLLLEQ